MPQCTGTKTLQSKGNIRLETKLLISLLTLLIQSLSAFSQVPADTLKQSLDSTGVVRDSFPAQPQSFKISEDSLDAPVNYRAADSMRYDIINKKIHLYGNAEVSYTTIVLNAAYIMLDWASNTVTAESTTDSLGNPSGVPTFKDGEQSFQARRMRYNFKSRKGIIYDAVSVQSDVYIRSERGKFIAQSQEIGDTSKTEDIIYSKNAIFTTCELPQPHFGIRSTKQKVVPNKTVIVGPSNLEIGGVPTPLWLPFGFFPISSTAQSGLIFPQDYGYDPKFGFGLNNVGYFTPLGQYFDLQLTADVYFKNRWGLHLQSRYNKRYKYNGQFNLDYANAGIEATDGTIIPEKSIILNWRHNQDHNAHPTIKFGGNISIQTNNYQRNFQNDFNSVSKNQLTSGLNFSYNPLDKPWSLNASLNNSQNVPTREVTINFPNLNFQTQRIFPFKKKGKTSGAWYENIGINYRANAKNRYTATDTTLFEGNILDKLQYGVQQSADADVSFKLLKYFRINPNVRYSETWYFQTLEKQFDPTTVITVQDTIFNEADSTDFAVLYDTTYGRQVIDTVDQFKPFRQVSTGVSMNFDLFGTILLKKGWLRGIRHYMKPSFSFFYSPDYTDPNLGYIKTVDSDNRPAFNEEEEYNIFLNGGVFSRPSLSGEQMAITYNISNVLQAKYFSAKDSAVQYFNILDDISLSGSYNMAVDSFQWSLVNFRLRANWFKGIVNINLSATFDPYITDDVTGRRLPTLVWTRYRRPFEFVNARLPFSNSFTVGQIRNWFAGDDDTTTRTEEVAELDEGEDFWSLFDNFRLSHNISFDLSRIDGKDTFRITTNALQLRGNIQITKNWTVSIDNIGYDFSSNQLVYPSFSFQRDLHCWEMGMGWQPRRGTYSFFLRVKPGPLGFIEVPYRRQNPGQFGGF